MLNFIYEFFIHNGLILKSPQEGKTRQEKNMKTNFPNCSGY